MATKPVFDDVKPFPGKASAPAAVGSVPGHNRPSPANDVVREFNDLLAQRDGFTDRCEALAGAAERAIATNEETAGRCGELVKQISAAERVINDAHKSAKEPYLEASRAVDSAKKAKLGPLEQAKATVTDKLNTFLRLDRKRGLARAEGVTIDDSMNETAIDKAVTEHRAAQAEQRRREEEARAANGPAPEPIAEPTPPPVAPEPTRIRGDFGALTTGKTVWRHEITDWEIAFMQVANNEKVREAIDKAIGAMVRSGVRQIEGVRIYSDVAAQVR